MAGWHYKFLISERFKTGVWYAVEEDEKKVSPLPMREHVRWVAVHMGASLDKKAWRPESFGRTMALLSQRMPVGFVLTGAAEETGGDEPSTVQQAVTAYHCAGGTAPLCDMVGRTDVAQLLAVLDECALMLTNDTGPMHLAVSVNTPVVNLSLGPAGLWETGPYGPGHWGHTIGN